MWIVLLEEWRAARELGLESTGRAKIIDKKSYSNCGYNDDKARQI